MAISVDSVLSVDADIETRVYLKGLVVDPGISLNEIATFIFRQFDGERSVHQVAECVTVEYRTTLEDCLPDVLQLASELVEFGILKVAADAH